MTSIQTRTPPFISRNNLLNQNHLHNNTQILPSKPRAKTLNHTHLDTRPDTPRFINNNNNENKNVLLAGNNTGRSNFINSVGPKQVITGNRLMMGENKNGKRPISTTMTTTTEVLDLTNTTGGISEPSSVPPIKKSKTTSTIISTTTNNNNNNNNISKNASTRIDAKGKSKESRAKKEREREQSIAESIAWRQKYKKAFPSFVFYFDALDNATEISLVKSVERLGASVDNFFSKKVTHVVTSRAIPSLHNNPNKENFNSPSVPNVLPRQKQPLTTSFLDSIAGPSKPNKKISGRSPISYSLADGQKLRQQYDQGLDKNPFIDSQDILSKASEFGLKIWRLDKAQLVISRINSYSPTKLENQRNNLSLPSLLRDEQVYGTRERDPFVPRPDTHYFSTQSCYVLVEDSTGEHRPIVTKEYEKPNRKRDDPTWPVLWGGVESRTAFYHYEGPPVIYEAKRIHTTLYEEPKPILDNTKNNNKNTLTVPTTLHRSISMGQIQRTQKNNIPFLLETNQFNHEKYIVASGNSQIITSNIASGTSTQSGAIRGNNSNRDPFCNRRLAALKQKTVSMGGGGLGLGLGGTGTGTGTGKLKRSASLDTGMNKRVPVAREEPKKPGYCENCRVKYDDFKSHVVSRKHLKFARTESNWTELDDLLCKIERPKIYVEELTFPSSDLEEEGEGEGEEEEKYEDQDSGFFEFIDTDPVLDAAVC